MNNRKSNLFGDDSFKVDAPKNDNEEKKGEQTNPVEENKFEETKSEIVPEANEKKQKEFLGIDSKSNEKQSDKSLNKEDRAKIENKLFGEKKSTKELYPSASSNTLLSEEEKGDYAINKEIQNIRLEKELRIFDIEEDADVTVSDPIKKEGFSSYVVYTVKAKYLKDPLFRRYNDFHSLRSKLTERWPGVYIPNIPPKKAVGNLESKIINYRMKILNKFCSRICKNKHLQTSEEFTTFLSNATDVEKALNSFGLQSYEEIYNKYKKAFPEYSEDFNFDAAKVKINEMNLFLQKTIASIRTFREQVNVCMQKKQQEMESYFSLLQIFNDYEKFSLLEFADQDDSKLLFFNPKNSELCTQLINLRDSLQNPYSKMHDWLIEEELDTEAIIESIASLNFLSETKEKLIHKKNTITNNINDLVTGKKTIKNFFSMKSKKSETTELEAQKLVIEGQITFLDLIVKISTFNMERNIKTFKEEKLASYYQSLKLCAEIQKYNGTNIHNLWNTISRDKNVLSIASKDIKMSHKTTTLNDFLAKSSDK